MRRLAGPCLALAALIALSACNERVVASEPAPAYARSEVVYAASNRDLRVVIYGNPFGEDPQRFTQRVTAAMRTAMSDIENPNPTTTPNDTARRDYSVVLAFNPVDTLLSSSLCNGNPVRTHAPGSSVVVQGAFCRGAPMTSATGWLDRGTSSDDPDFRQLIADMMVSLFPTRTSNEDRCTGGDC